METYEIIKKFLTEGGKCILIENNKPVGVVLTIEEYEKLQSAGRQIPNPKSETPTQSPPYQGGEKEGVVAANPIGEAMAKEMDPVKSVASNGVDSPEVSAEIADIEAADDVTLEDLGIDELPY